MSPGILSELLKLSAAERIQLAQYLWDSIPDDSDALRLPPELLDEMEERLAEHRADPSSAIPSDKARARLRKWT
ncbi:MAG TPA: addiction module protein [Longimicrobium sp.]|jgi:putative addiction module component (TIGR02574 family)